jgi:hypothetical protein
MKATVKLNSAEIRQAISDYIAERAGLRLRPDDLVVEVKSKQNYRSEWEQADIRVECEAMAQ